MTSKLLVRGQQVDVLHRLTFSTVPRIEGSAKLIAPLGALHGLWRVQFEGEKQTCLRLVHGCALQQHTQEIIDFLTAHFQVAINPSLLIDPDNPFQLKR